MNRSWMTISRRITVLGNILALTGLLAFSAVILDTRYKKSGEGIDEAAKDVLSLLKHTTAILVWNFDTVGLENVRKQTKINFIEGINWKDKSGKSVIAEPKIESLEKNYVVSSEIFGPRGDVIGSIDLTYNRKSQWNDFVADARLIVLGVGLLLILQLLSLSGVWWAGSKMLISLDSLVGQIQDSSNLNYEKSDTVKETAASVSLAAEEQAASVTETTAALQQIRSMMEKSADHIQKSAQAAQTGNQLAQDGKETARQMIDAVNDINEANEQLTEKVNIGNRQISEISAMIREIASKTKVINQIAFQTKLLSFNAAVEAATAGEAGKGFAVVAEEVGKLAKVSGTAAQEIDTLLQVNIKKTEDIVRMISDGISTASQVGKAKVQHGIIVARKCEEVLDTLANSVEQLKGRMDDVQSSSIEQTMGIDNISISIDRIQQKTEMNAKNARIADDVSESLVQEASNLSTIVKQMEYSLFGNRKNSKSQQQSDKSNQTAA